MGIPIGKLSLYTACGGLHPATTLPILLDVGTDNPERLADPLYIGWRHERVRGQEYDDFVEEFVQAVIERWPHVLLQWEDFARDNATRLLERYRDRLCTFNDDIQGTAAVAAGTLLAAINVTGVPLREQRIASSARARPARGISALLLRAMIEDGLSEARGPRSASTWSIGTACWSRACRASCRSRSRSCSRATRSRTGRWSSASRDRPARRGAQREADGADRRVGPARRVLRERRAGRWPRPSSGR